MGNTTRPQDALLLVGDPINTPRDTPYDVSRYVAPFSAAPRPSNTRVTKIGLIDPDDPTKEEDGSHVDKGNTSSMARVLDSPTQLIRRPLLLIDWDDECGSNR